MRSDRGQWSGKDSVKATGNEPSMNENTGIPS